MDSSKVMLNDIVEALEHKDAKVADLKERFSPPWHEPADVQEILEASWLQASMLYGSCKTYLERYGAKGFAEALSAKSNYTHRRVCKKLR